MRRNVVLYATTLWLALCLWAQASTVPLLVPHQGRLLDNNEAPVSGMRALTFALYGAPTGGAPLWTEVHGAVLIEDGLFTVNLGSVTPLSSDLFSPPSALPPFERYLEVSVDGETLAPRSRLGAAPYSVTSTRVDGDVVTAPGELHVSSLSGSTTGTIRTSTDSAGYSFSSGGASHAFAWTTPDAAVATVSNAAGTRGVVTAASTGSSSIIMHEGPMEAASLKTTDDSTRFSLSSKRSDHVFVNQFDVDLSPDITKVSLDSDSDGDGDPESGMEFTARSKQSEAKSNSKASFTTQSRMFSDTASGGLETSLDLDNDGTPEMSSSHESTASGSVSRWIGRTGSTTGTIRLVASPDSVVDTRDADSDDDGLSDAQVVLRVTPRDGLSGTGSEGSIVLSTDHAAGGPRQSVSMDGSFSHAQHQCVTDLDRDGIPDVVVISSSSSTEAVSQLLVDSDDDGTPDDEIELSSYPGGTTSKAITTKGTGALGMVKSTTSAHVDSGAMVQCLYDNEGDGSPDVLVESSASSSTAKHAINTKGTGAQGGFVFSGGSLTDGGRAHSFVWRQEAGLPILLQEVSLLANADSAGVVVANKGGGTGSLKVSTEDPTDPDTDDDGVCDFTTSSSGAVGTLRSRSGSTTGTIRMVADSGDVTEAITDDIDGDGHSDSKFVITARDTYGNCQLATDIDDDGVSDYSVETTCDAIESRLTLKGALSVGTGSLDFTVGNDAPVITMADLSGVRMLMRPDSGLQLFDDLGAKTVHLSTGGTVTVSGSLTLGSASASHFIDVQGGAYCDGTDWVSVSDVASKENFKPINGGEILERIAELEITRWNYKGRPGVEHIGPMAQDFKSAFGVGADDKTISSIDPSGIALAAIQELQKQNRDLHSENAELRSALEALTRKVDALVATR